MDGTAAEQGFSKPDLHIVDGLQAGPRLSQKLLGLAADPNGGAAGGWHEASGLQMLQQLPLGLAIYSADGKLLHSNTQYARLVCSPDLPSHASSGVRHWQGIAPGGTALPLHDYPCQRALRGETVCPGIDLLHVRTDGTTRWLSVNASPVIDMDKGAVVGIVLLFLDAHDRIEAAVSAARAGRRFCQFAENSSSAIWIADVQTRQLDYRNPQHVLLTGQDRTIDRLDDWIGFIDEMDRDLVRQCYDRVMRGTTEHLEYDLRANGWHHIRETCFPIRDEAGTIVMIGGIAERITARQRGILYLIGKGDEGSWPLRDLLERQGHQVKLFPCVDALLDMADFLAIGGVVIDMATTTNADLELPRLLADPALTLPVMVVGRADTPACAAIAAMRAGAADYLIPPFTDAELTQAIRRISARMSPPAAEPLHVADDRIDRHASLTKREREVLAGLRAGGTNKSIGRDLGISPRTVELHRSHLMERMNAKSLADLLCPAA